MRSALSSFSSPIFWEDLCLANIAVAAVTKEILCKSWGELSLLVQRVVISKNWKFMEQNYLCTRLAMLKPIFFNWSWILMVCKEGQNCQEFLLTEWAFKKWVEKTQTASYNGLISVFTISLLPILLIQLKVLFWK